MNGPPPLDVERGPKRPPGVSPLRLLGPVGGVLVAASAALPWIGNPGPVEAVAVLTLFPEVDAVEVPLLPIFSIVRIDGPSLAWGLMVLGTLGGVLSLAPSIGWPRRLAGGLGAALTLVFLVRFFLLGSEGGGAIVDSVRHVGLGAWMALVGSTLLVIAPSGETIFRREGG